MPNFLYLRATLRHAKKIKNEDSCSQISPLKKYIKRTNHLAVWGMTTAGGGTIGLRSSVEVQLHFLVLFQFFLLMHHSKYSIVKNRNAWECKWIVFSRLCRLCFLCWITYIFTTLLPWQSNALIKCLIICKNDFTVLQLVAKSTATDPFPNCD